ncbi:MAG: FkbM family methyltransferase [Salibacteraceae bacterium]|jgi:FkbM family methyltransferase
MKQVIKKIFHQLPFSLRFFFKKNVFRNIDEVEIVHEILKDKIGLMLDVGAHFGTSLDLFMKDGWEIHAFEPDPKNRKKLLEKIKGKPNVKLSTDAVTNQSGLELSFYSSEVSTGISGLSSFHASHKEVAKVNTITLKDYITKNKIKGVDFLKIDTEGHDLFVLQGFDWDNHSHPEVIVCEFEDKKSLPLGYKTNDMISFLEEKGYHVILSEWFPIVEYGMSHKWKSFNTENLLERDKSKNWGNLIGYKCDTFKESFQSKVNN